MKAMKKHFEKKKFSSPFETFERYAIIIRISTSVEHCPLKLGLYCDVGQDSLVTNS